MAIKVEVFPPAIVPAANPVFFQISTEILDKPNLQIGLILYTLVDGVELARFEDLTLQMLPWPFRFTTLA